MEEKIRSILTPLFQKTNRFRFFSIKFNQTTKTECAMAGKPKPVSQIKQLLQLYKLGKGKKSIARSLNIWINRSNLCHLFRGNCATHTGAICATCKFRNILPPYSGHTAPLIPVMLPPLV